MIDFHISQWDPYIVSCPGHFHWLILQQGHRGQGQNERLQTCSTSELSKQESRWSCWHFCPLWFSCRWLFRLLKTAFYITTALNSLGPKKDLYCTAFDWQYSLEVNFCPMVLLFQSMSKRITNSKNVLKNNWACIRDKGIW